MPTSVLSGVPLKVRVPALKVSQEGSAEPLERRAIAQRVAHIDVGKRSPGTVKLNAASSVAA